MANTRPINEYLAYLLAQAERQLHRQLDQEFRAEGVPVEQWRILKLLAEENGRPMGDLAEAALLNHPTLTKTIDRMVSGALVYRRADKSDGRRVLIFISERGRAVIQRLNKLANSHQAEIVESYGNRQAEELKRLIEGLIQRTG
ncbi:MAG: MarR family transcriptional regulator [Proteobacteria bacterium]|nr:MarR family transcriptional regulator [Pseudomonadota bacterium]